MGKEEKLSWGGAVHRRRVLAGERQKAPVDLIRRRISDLEQAEKRLQEINACFEKEDNLTSQKQACLDAELIWLEFRLERITQSERQSRLQRLLNGLEVENNGVYRWLTEENSDGLTPLSRIRNDVMPSRRVGGYYVKKMR